MKTTFSEIDEESFESGFMLAYFVARHIGQPIDDEKLFETLRAIAAGDETLLPSPHDAIKAIEKDFGRELPESLRKSVERMMGSDRAARDTFNREAASALLRMMKMDE